MRGLNYILLRLHPKDETVASVQAFVDPNNLDRLRQLEDIVNAFGLRIGAVLRGKADPRLSPPKAAHVLVRSAYFMRRRFPCTE